jgi:wyosine [tRNA(Phe)-imidazoG37] synthetase (radical SAM superfamily)
MKYVFGPVPSRRLGRSLGIDPVPLKTCNYNCIYCQLGHTRRLERKRKAFFSVSAMLAETATALTHHGSAAIDWITFVGSGETTLFSRLGSLIRFVKSMTELPVAVITNGSLLYLPNVREELSAADAVLPSLDAGSASLFTRINRPHRDFSFDQQVEGLEEFRRIFQGHLWMEVMLLGGVNDSPDALQAIAAVLQRVEPDEIHIATPTRPPSEPWVELPSREGLERASSIFGDVARVLQTAEVDVMSGVDENISDAVVTIVSRHPMREDELVQTLKHWSPGRVFEALANLAEGGIIRVIERHGKRFWCAANIEFPDEKLTGNMQANLGGVRETTGFPA